MSDERLKPVTRTGLTDGFDGRFVGRPETTYLTKFENIWLLLQEKSSGERGSKRYGYTGFMFVFVWTEP